MQSNTLIDSLNETFCIPKIYLGAALTILTLIIIFDGAFGIRQVAGGLFGATIMQGIRRGLFSNEAGEGSTPNAAAIAETFQEGGQRVPHRHWHHDFHSRNHHVAGSVGLR